MYTFTRLLVAMSDVLYPRQLNQIMFHLVWQLHEAYVNKQSYESFTYKQIDLEPGKRVYKIVINQNKPMVYTMNVQKKDHLLEIVGKRVDGIVYVEDNAREIYKKMLKISDPKGLVGYNFGIYGQDVLDRLNDIHLGYSYYYILFHRYFTDNPKKIAYTTENVVADSTITDNMGDLAEGSDEDSVGEVKFESYESEEVLESDDEDEIDWDSIRKDFIEQKENWTNPTRPIKLKDASGIFKQMYDSDEFELMLYSDIERLINNTLEKFTNWILRGDYSFHPDEKVIFSQAQWNILKPAAIAIRLYKPNAKTIKNRLLQNGDMIKKWSISPGTRTSGIKDVWIKVGDNDANTAYLPQAYDAGEVESTFLKTFAKLYGDFIQLAYSMAGQKNSVLQKKIESYASKNIEAAKSIYERAKKLIV